MRKKQRSEAEIQEMLEGYRKRGGMTRRAFSEKQGIALSTLAYYLHRHRKSARRPVRLARVELSTVEPASRFTLVLSNGRRIECDEGGLALLVRTAEEL